jgi:hypothetical protein
MGDGTQKASDRTSSKPPLRSGESIGGVGPVFRKN